MSHDQLLEFWDGVFSEKLKREDIITVKSWMTLGDSNYEIDHDDEDSMPESGIVYCNIEHIHKFFKKCEKTDNKYIVISGFSDYGVAKQQDNPVSLDLIKFMPFIYNEISNLGYEPLIIPPRCEPDKCNIEDEYSVRCHSYTYSTFDKIPDNVIKWYTVNSRVNDPRIEHIPLGVGKDAADEILATEEVSFSNKINLAYLNWQDHTSERSDMKIHFGQQNMHWTSVVNTPERSYRDYLDDLSKHYFIISPEGNGWDCYRNLEAIYTRSIPVVSQAPPVEYMEDLPVLVLETMFDLSEGRLVEFITEEKKYNLDKSKLSYWKNKIESSRSLL